MASQFTGTDKANLLSTALEADSGDTIAITATSDAVVQGLDADDTIVIDKDVSTFVVAGGVGADTILLSGSTTSSDISGNRGEDTVSVSGDLVSSVVKGGENDDEILITNSVSESTLYGGAGNDTVDITSTETDFFKSLISDARGNNTLSASVQSFSSSSIIGGGGYDNISATAANDVVNSFLQGADGNDTVSASGAFDRSTIAGGAGNDDVNVTGAVTNAYIYGGAGNDDIDVTLTTNDLSGTLIKDSSGNNAIDVIATTGEIQTLTVEGGSGKDNVTLDADTSDSVFKGGKGNDVTSITGAVSDSTIYLGAGDDQATAGEAGKNITNTLFQSATGDNTYTLTATQVDGSTLIGGTGDDVLDVTGSMKGGVYNFGDGDDEIQTVTNIDDANITFGEGNDTLTAAGTFKGNLYLGVGDDSVDINGLTSESVIQSSAGANQWDIESADTITLISGSGNDNIDVHTGSFLTIATGSGKDTLDMTDTTDDSEIKLEGGDDLLRTTGVVTATTIYGGEGQDSLTATASLTRSSFTDTQGSSHLNLDGGSSQSTIVLGSGADTLDFDGAAHSLSSFDLGAGNDTLDLSAHDFDGSTLKAGDGDDTIQFNGAANVGAGGEDVKIFLGAGNDSMTIVGVATSTAIESLTGNNRFESDDQFGNAAATTSSIKFGSGTDTVIMDDVMARHATIDTGAGNDLIDLEQAMGGGIAQLATVKAGDGTDTLTLSNATAGGDIADDEFTDISGAEVLTVGDGANDNDVLLGAKAQAAGITTAVLTNAATTSDLVATDYTVAITLDASAVTANGADLLGGTKADTLIGGTGVNGFTTNSGNDTITSGGGADTYTIDGTGDQTITVNGVAANATFTIQNASATVNAEIKAASTLQAAANNGVLNLTLTDDVANAATVSAANVTTKGVTIDATANNNDDLVLIGSALADTIKSGEGDDVITGGDGKDEISLGKGTDQVKYSESGSADVDTVTGFTSGSDLVGFSKGNIDNGGASDVLQDENAADVGALAAGAFVVTSHGAAVGGEEAMGAAANLIFLSSVTTDTFAAAIGTTQLINVDDDIDTAMSAATKVMAAVYYDKGDTEAVFGYIANTDKADNRLDADDTFVEITRINMAAADYTSANIDASLFAF